MADPDRRLEGRTILVTRALAQGGDLRRRLEALGAAVVHIPVIEIVPPADFGCVDDAVGRLAAYDWVVFTSANAVDAFLDRAGSLPDVRVAAVGRQTARALGRRRVGAQLVPDTFRAEGLLEAFPRELDGVRILLPRAEIADETLAETLRSRGATVDVLVVYRNRLPRRGRPELRRLLAGGGVDCIVLTSGSTVDNLIAMAGGAESLRGPAIAVIGPVTRRAAEAAGLAVDIEAVSATVDGLVAAIRGHY